ncbi:MAG: TlpA family protein disulfide reductase [Anaerolineales bacterium]|nr:TlpA family protein disulfide reductase [Anaerolineales bacterium]
MSNAFQNWGVRLLVVGFVMLLAVACGGGTADTNLDDGRRMAIEQMPGGAGRGFPEGVIIGDGASNAGLQPGQAAPDFTMVWPDGRFTSLADLRGRPVAVNFWATWCPPCRMEMPELVKAAKDPDLVVLAVNAEETVSLVNPFAEEYEMSMPVVMDPEGKLQDLYEVRALPTTVFIDRDGNIASVYTGAMTPQTLSARLAEIR